MEKRKVIIAGRIIPKNKVYRLLTSLKRSASSPEEKFLKNDTGRERTRKYIAGETAVSIFVIILVEDNEAQIFIKLRETIMQAKRAAVPASIEYCPEGITLEKTICVIRGKNIPKRVPNSINNKKKKTSLRLKHLNTKTNRSLRVIALSGS